MNSPGASLAIPVPGVVQVHDGIIAQQTHAYKHTGMILPGGQSHAQTHDVRATIKLQFNGLVAADLPRRIGQAFPAIAEGIANIEAKI